jgi:hypothetical protein
MGGANKERDETNKERGGANKERGGAYRERNRERRSRSTQNDGLGRFKAAELLLRHHSFREQAIVHLPPSKLFHARAAIVEVVAKTIVLVDDHLARRTKADHEQQNLQDKLELSTRLPQVKSLVL